MTQLTDTWMSFLTTFATVLFAAYIGSYLALGKYKKEKVWQEKYNAYQDILNSINKMLHWADEISASHQCLPVIGGTSEKELYQDYRDARKCISKYINVGKLLISNEVADKLSETDQLLWEEYFRFDNEGIDESNYNEKLAYHAEYIKIIINGRLEDIIKLCKKDLK